jgi:hypothetical protein
LHLRNNTPQPPPPLPLRDMYMKHAQVMLPLRTAA